MQGLKRILFWGAALEIAIMGGCAGGSSPSLGTGGASTSAPVECSAEVEEPCMRYHIPLVGNPSTDVALRSKYVAAFGSACYMSAFDTFDCFYAKWQAACADAVKIGEVSGNAAYDKGYVCQPVGNGDYTLQIGSDVANFITINYQAAPRQTPLIEVDGVPTEVNGPYRNLAQAATIEPGKTFYDTSGMVDADGGPINQRTWILKINRDAHDGGVHSDLAGFMWDCEQEDGSKTKCEEPIVLGDPDQDGGPPPYPGSVAQVHHVVPMKDLRCCPWGTNSNKNAAVISAKLNNFLKNNNPPEEEVKQLNKAPSYLP